MTTGSHHRLSSIDLIHPNLKPAYSSNLYRWLNRAHRQRLSQSYDVMAYHLQPQDRRGKHMRIIGWMTPDGLNGASLDRILYDLGTENVGYVGLNDRLSIDEEFWPLYLQVGLCAYDPEHRLSFAARRFVTNSDRRWCVWCGLQQTRKIIKKIVIDEVWVSGE
jgi:hypothetical protein